MTVSTTPTDPPAELQVGDRVQLEDQGLMSDYGTVVEPPTLMYPDDPGPRVRVVRAYDSTEEIAPLVSEVRRIPPDEEQEVWLQRWIVTGEQICDDPDEYNHAHMLFVHEGDLPEIIRTYLAANGLTPPGVTPVKPTPGIPEEAVTAAPAPQTHDEYRRLWMHRFDTLLSNADVLDADDQLVVLDVHEALLAEQYHNHRAALAARDNETAELAWQVGDKAVWRGREVKVLAVNQVVIEDLGTALTRDADELEQHPDAASLRGGQ